MTIRDIYRACGNIPPHAHTYIYFSEDCYYRQDSADVEGDLFNDSEADNWKDTPISKFKIDMFNRLHVHILNVDRNKE